MSLRRNYSNNLLLSQKKVEVRYKQSMDGTMQDIKKVLNEINWPKGAKRVSYQVAPYSAMADYSLATITFTY